MKTSKRGTPEEERQEEEEKEEEEKKDVKVGKEDEEVILGSL